MLPFLSSDRDPTIAITPVTAAALPLWLDEHSQHRDWLAATGFKAEPGTFAFLADENRQLKSVLASPLEGEAVWSFAGLPLSLPEGAYRLDLTGTDLSPTDVAVGWALGAYGF